MKRTTLLRALVGQVYGSVGEPVDAELRIAIHGNEGLIGRRPLGFWQPHHHHDSNRQNGTCRTEVVGLDTKFWFEKNGHRVFKPDTGDLVRFYDLADPAHPAPLDALPLTNSVVGSARKLRVIPIRRDVSAFRRIGITRDRTHRGRWLKDGSRQ